LSFIESYFSNRIEGTEFELHEAEEIVFERVVPEQRFDDAHDILGTFDLVNDAAKRALVPRDAEELIDLPVAAGPSARLRPALRGCHPVAGPSSRRACVGETGALISPDEASETGARLQLPVGA
jgi:hypothetical protein